MDFILPYVVIFGALIVAIMSPGPSFILIARIATHSRLNGVAAAVGLGIGSLILASIVLLGIDTLLANAPNLYLGIKVLGALYLLYLATMMWRGSKNAFFLKHSKIKSAGYWRFLMIGVLTQISNPKAIIFFASVFSALLPQNPGLVDYVILLIGVLILESGWYVLMACAFSSGPYQSLYVRSKVFFDNTAALFMTTLAAKVLYDSIKST